LPLIESSNYRPGLLYRNTQLSTTLPTLLRRVGAVPFKRERMTTSDGDFIDLDCLWQGAESTVVLCHGLEGNAHRQYMLGMGLAFERRRWNVVAYNFRGCSGEPNLKAYSYHSGKTDDLQEVLDYLQMAGHTVRALVGFSLGGNLILKYLGENPEAVLPSIEAAVAFSVPVDLAETTRVLERKGNWAYNRRFLRKLSKKIRLKAAMFPGEVDISLLDGVKSLKDFDDVFTAPLSGFVDADDYYRRCSCGQFLSAIKVPSLLVSADNDPFLGESCYPRATAGGSEFFHLETPRHGGHVGFHLTGGEYWSEKRAVDFVEEKSTQVTAHPTPAQWPPATPDDPASPGDQIEPPHDHLLPPDIL